MRGTQVNFLTMKMKVCLDLLKKKKYQDMYQCLLKICWCHTFVISNVKETTDKFVVNNYLDYLLFY